MQGKDSLWKDIDSIRSPNARKQNAWKESDLGPVHSGGSPSIGARSGGFSPANSAPHLWREINELRKFPPSQRVSQRSKTSTKTLQTDKLNDTCCAHLVRNSNFEFATLAVIICNAGFIGYDAEYAAKWGKPKNLYSTEALGFPIMENLFTIYFTFEVVCRFFAFRRWIHLIEFWFVFDTTLVLLMVAETYVLAFITSGGGVKQLSVLRLLRLLRITRMGKLVRYFPELQIIVTGMVAAVRSVASAAVLLVLVLYVFSIIFTNVYHQGLEDDDLAESRCEEGIPSACANVLFGSLGKSMRHLFIMGTILDDLTKCTDTIRGTSNTIMLFVLIVFVLISSFTMLNMLIGILCEVVQATAEAERLKSSTARIRDAITSLFCTLDEDDSGTISRQEFLHMRDDRAVKKALAVLKVRPRHFGMYADLMFDHEDGEEEGLPLDQVCNLIMELRPGAGVRALDFEDFKRVVSKNNFLIKSAIIRVDRLVAAVAKEEEKEAGNWQNEQPLKKVTLQDLEKVPDSDIINEICKRLGMNAYTPMPKDSTAKMVEAFETLGVALFESEDGWTTSLSKEIYSC